MNGARRLGPRKTIKTGSANRARCSEDRCSAEVKLAKGFRRIISALYCWTLMTKKFTKQNDKNLLACLRFVMPLSRDWRGCTLKFGALTKLTICHNGYLTFVVLL